MILFLLFILFFYRVEVLAFHSSFPIYQSSTFLLLSHRDSSIQDHYGKEFIYSSRRDWFHQIAYLAPGLATISPPKLAHGEALDSRIKNSYIPACLCDPSVSTYKNPTNGRIVHILGTAHISSASAEVAGQLVRDMKPSAVFVELDSKRVGRAIPKPNSENYPPYGLKKVQQPLTTAEASVKSTEQSDEGQENQNHALNGAKTSSGEPYQSDRIESPPVSKQLFNIKGLILDKASQAIGHSIKGLYQKLENDGFSAGEEFVVAVREGFNVGSKIILGDQDVEVTLRRLTEALSKTDLKKLLAADSEMEENMKQLLPDNGKGFERSDGMSKKELSYFVETVKAKENVKLLMGNLKKVAPEIYNALVRERDEYMANGIDKLNQFDSIVAVMGIAHVDGVESFLQSRGWEEVKVPCSV